MEFKKTLRGQIEFRFDPLTNHQTRINPARAKRPKLAEIEVSLREIGEKGKEKCPFCPERIEEKTPQFSPQICPEGRIRIGQTVIFPNLNPFAENQAVGVMSKDHFLDLDEFEEQMLEDNLIGSKNYILAVYQKKPEAIWPVWVWNYMPPSAGSMPHPHCQIWIESKETNGQKKIIERCLNYYGLKRKNFWSDLIEEEKKKGERFIAENDSLVLISSFAPRGFNEIQFIFKDLSSISELTEEKIIDFASLLKKALIGYKEIGVGSFNLVSFSGPLDKPDPRFYWLNFKLFSRPYPRGVYTSDTGPMERMYDTWVIDTLPEVTAERLRPFLK